CSKKEHLLRLFESRILWERIEERSNVIEERSEDPPARDVADAASQIRLEAAPPLLAPESLLLPLPLPSLLALHGQQASAVVRHRCARCDEFLRLRAAPRRRGMPRARTRGPCAPGPGRAPPRRPRRTRGG